MIEKGYRGRGRTKIYITAPISSDILAIIALCLTIYLAKQNQVLNNYKNKIYISMSVLVIVLLVLEMLTVLIDLPTVEKLVIPNRLVNIVGFSLSPVIPYIFLCFLCNEEKKIFHHRFLQIPLYLNAIVCILSYKTGWVFYVDAQNQYTRGNLFLLPMIVCALYLGLTIYAINNSTDEDIIDNKNLLAIIILLPMIGAVFQIIFKDLLLIWGSVALSLLLFYIFLREIQFKYDIQTEIKNRTAFEKEMEKYSKDNKNVAIVVLDINNLKKTNDRYGHKAGDEMIFNVARIIEESFIGIGKTYRIGGDEFCVICKEINKEVLCRALAKLEDLLITTNKKSKIEIQIAYGYAFYIKKENNNIYSVFKQADRAMYKHKSKLKGHYGRRIDD